MNKLRQIPKTGFTLAEMLVVLMIVSLIAISSLPFVNKHVRMQKDDAVHGKYECYRHPTTDALYEKQWNNNVLDSTKNGVNPVVSCSFQPPAEATYFIVQAVGAGGGGAYGGTAPAVPTASVTSGYNIIMPIDGTQLTTDYPSAANPYPVQWAYDAMDADSTSKYRLQVTVYGGGGGGGHGDMSGTNFIDPSVSNKATCLAQLRATTPSTPMEYGYNDPYATTWAAAQATTSYTACRWWFASYSGGVYGNGGTGSQYNGGKGGDGGSATMAYQKITTSLRVNAQSGNGGGPAAMSSGTQGYPGTNGTLVYSPSGGTLTAYGGTGGYSATQTGGNGLPGTPGADGGAGLGLNGGAGGLGMNIPGSGKEPMPPEGFYNTGIAGTKKDPVIQSTSTSLTKNYFPFTMTDYSVVMKYGSGGKAGEYKTMFFRKLANNIPIYIGIGGIAGTSGTPLGGNATAPTTFGTILSAAGGTGGTLANQSISGISLYNASFTTYRNGLVSSYSLAKDPTSGDILDGATNILSIRGAGVEGFYVALTESQSDGSTLDTGLGSGGRGGGTTVGIGYSMATRTLNGNSYGAANYPSGASVNYSTVGTIAAEKGHPGAVVIIW